MSPGFKDTNATQCFLIRTFPRLSYLKTAGWWPQRLAETCSSHRVELRAKKDTCADCVIIVFTLITQHNASSETSYLSLIAISQLHTSYSLECEDADDCERRNAKQAMTARFNTYQNVCDDRTDPRNTFCPSQATTRFGRLNFTAQPHLMRWLSGSYKKCVVKRHNRCRLRSWLFDF